jgi:hypothetical protein
LTIADDDEAGGFGWRKISGGVFPDDREGFTERAVEGTSVEFIDENGGGPDVGAPQAKYTRSQVSR